MALGMPSTVEGGTSVVYLFVLHMREVMVLTIQQWFLLLCRFFKKKKKIYCLEILSSLNAQFTKVFKRGGKPTGLVS